MIVSVLGHLSFNLRSLFSYLKTRSVSIFGGVTVCLLVVLYGVSINNKVPAEIAEPMDSLAAEAESHD
jgi:hypothetical protein